MSSFERDCVIDDLKEQLQESQQRRSKLRSNFTEIRRRLVVNTKLIDTIDELEKGMSKLNTLHPKIS
jgi:hypothetical protein